MARPFKPYQTSWGEVIPGLYRGSDGRWRIVATNGRFREPDERRAVDRFRAMTVKPPTPVPFVTADSLEEVFIASLPAVDHTPEEERGPGPITFSKTANGYAANRDMPTDELWQWFREQLITRPAHVATMTGIPELASLATMQLPQESIRLSDLIARYVRENPSTQAARRRAQLNFCILQEVTQAKTIADLTQERISLYRQHIEKTIPGAGTRKWTYGTIKAVFGFGLKIGLDAVQIRIALDRCKVLWTAAKQPASSPHPISPSDFHALLSVSNDQWRAILLLGLNCCLHLGEILALKWESFKGGKYSASREKTGVPRGAVLWKETIEAMSGISRKSPHVFTSTHGTKFNRNTKVNDFAALRQTAGLPSSVKFDDIRDGAYTAALQHCEEKIVRVLAGHKAAGLLDSYVLRNPEMTRPACEAVYKAYLSAPASSTPTSATSGAPVPTPAS